MVGRKVDGQILFGARSEKPKNIFGARSEKWKNLFGAKWQLRKILFGSQRINTVIIIWTNQQGWSFFLLVNRTDYQPKITGNLPKNLMNHTNYQFWKILVNPSKLKEIYSQFQQVVITMITALLINLLFILIHSSV